MVKSVTTTNSVRKENWNQRRLAGPSLMGPL